MKGRIRSIPLFKEIAEGMQVVWKNKIVMKICKTEDKRGGHQIGLTKDGTYAVSIMYCSLDELTVLMLESLVDGATFTTATGWDISPIDHIQIDERQWDEIVKLNQFDQLVEYEKNDEIAFVKTDSIVYSEQMILEALDSYMNYAPNVFIKDKIIENLRNIKANHERKN